MLRGIKYFRHLAMVDIVEVVTEGGMGVLMLKGLILALVASAALLVSR